MRLVISTLLKADPMEVVGFTVIIALALPIIYLAMVYL